MLALSVKQPWAWAIFSQPPKRPPHVRAKDVENRNWHTNHAGWTYIHAGQTYDEPGRLWMRKELGVYAPEEPDCEMGGIVGVVRFVSCVRNWRSPWFAGPYGFVLEKAYPLPFAYCRGQLKFFDPSRDGNLPPSYAPP